MTAALCLLAAVAAVIENEQAKIEFDAAGRVTSIYEKTSARELAGEPWPFVAVIMADGSRVEPTRLEFSAAEKGIAVDFAFPEGAAKLLVTPYGSGWTVETVDCTVPGAEEFVYASLRPVCAERKGPLSNIVMDDRSAVAVRAYEPESEMGYKETGWKFAKNDGKSEVSILKRHGFRGWRAGFTVASRARILDNLKDMLKASGIVSTGCGGPYSQESETNDRGYLFTSYIDDGSLEDWLRLADRTGLSTMHISRWYRTNGSYQPNPVSFPHGWADLDRFAEGIRKAGRHFTTHTLSAAIQFGDPLIAPKWFDQMLTEAEYTLAKDFHEGDNVLYVNEVPSPKQAKVMTGVTCGTILRIGDDLVTYGGFSREKPYRFTGIKLALEAYGEKAIYDDSQADHTAMTGLEDDRLTPSDRRFVHPSYAAGTRVAYMRQRYGEFMPKPGSELAKICVAAIRNVYDRYRLDGLYLDGAEAWGDRCAVDTIRRDTLTAVASAGRPVFNSTSCRNAFNWWQRSVIGSLDSPAYGIRSFIDRHIRVYRDFCAADFLKTDFGWWNVRSASETSRGYFPEEMEYYGAKTVGHRSTSSLQRAFVTDEALAYQVEDQVTLFGWWERARASGAVREELLPRLRETDADFRLRQDRSGEWRIIPVDVAKHRVATPDFAEWTLDAREARPAEIRIEALYAADREAAKTNSLRLIDASMKDSLALAGAKGVEAKVEYGKNIRLTASNGGVKDAKSAWVSLVRRLPDLEYMEVNPVSSLWVKGDGSGAILNVQIHKAKIFGEAASENYVKLDFTGWRKVELLTRERDADLCEKYTWPYEPKDRLNTPTLVFRNPITGKTNDAFGFWLNGIPEGGKVDIEIGPWDSLPQKKGVLARGAKLALNGGTLDLPFDLAGGEWATLVDGRWTHYAETGEPQERVAGPAALALRRGVNRLRFDSPSRAEVTLFGIGASEPAFRTFDEKARRFFATEYEQPVILRAGKGLGGPFAVRVRPGETARLGFEMLGPVRNPVVAGRRFPVTLRDTTEKLVCDDGEHWKVVRLTPGKVDYRFEVRVKASKRETLASGSVEPLPRLGPGENFVTVTADGADGARLSFFKYYP